VAGLVEEALHAAIVSATASLHFINRWDPMLAPGGKPREDLWVEDRIHPNHAGYLLRVAIMRPLLGASDRVR
jgi:hypothetical protein